MFKDVETCCGGVKRSRWKKLAPFYCRYCIKCRACVLNKSCYLNQSVMKPKIEFVTFYFMKSLEKGY